MPRILPRLRKAISEQTVSSSDVFWTHRRPRRRKSLHRPVPPEPSLKPADYEESILLYPGNPITNSRDFVRHKSLPPRSQLKERVTAPSFAEDAPREMTEEERTWWADPYLRMIASPLRRCILTDRYLPSDFMIRLAPMRVPKPRLVSESKLGNINRTLVPDGLEHPRFKTRKSGKAAYILCWKDAISQMIERESYKRIMPRQLPVHSLLIPQIEHLLRVRILQEFAIFSERLQSNPREAGTPMVLRRLTRREWNTLKTSGSIPWEDAVAIIVLPPLNRDPTTKMRPRPLLSPPPTEVLVPDARLLPPISVLYPVSPNNNHPTPPEVFPQPYVPLYNGLSIFPNRAQRAVLYNYLTSILRSETRRQPKSVHVQAAPRRALNSEDKASHAFLLTSSGKTSRRADVASVATALWRYRMFNGAGWESENTEHWVSKTSRKRPTE